MGVTRRVEWIGIPAMMQPVEQYGGRRLYIPVNATPDHAIAQLIGVDKLAALGKVYGLQEHFYIPKATKAPGLSWRAQESGPSRSSTDLGEVQK
jgi:hypothetical protein